MFEIPFDEKKLSRIILTPYNIFKDMEICR